MNKKFLGAILIAGLLLSGCGAEKNSEPVELDSIKNFPEIVDALAARNLIDEAILVSRCGLDDEKIITDVAAHKDEPLNYLSMILTRRNHE